MSAFIRPPPPANENIGIVARLGRRQSAPRGAGLWTLICIVAGVAIGWLAWHR